MAGEAIGLVVAVHALNIHWELEWYYEQCVHVYVYIHHVWVCGCGAYAHNYYLPSCSVAVEVG